MNKIQGMHLLIDGITRDSITLEPANICDLFDALVPALEMQYLIKPIATRVPYDINKLNSNNDEGGWSVIAQITTSHISLHGWPLRKAFMMDIFSCKPFNSDNANELVFSYLHIEKFSSQLIHRGLDIPASCFAP
jgi:S-adenosylmethionine decarboxylase